MKKKIIIIVTAIFSFFVIAGISLVVFYNSSLEAVNKSDKESYNKEIITFIVPKGATSRSIVDSLYDEGLIKNKYAGYIFLKLNDGYILQAGVYELDNTMNVKEIFDTIATGKVVDNSISVTFIEGKRITNYVKVINKNFGYSEKEILDVLADKTYLKELTEKYWFLTEDILNDKLYYALEGYLAPNTYRFEKDASVKTIVEKMLDATGSLLDKNKELIDNSEYSIHEILTMASIVELEGANSDDRFGVAGVFYNRLNAKMSLGSDVTTYYGARVEMSERDLYVEEINAVNDYNTRPAAMMGKLPIGPISNPSYNAIEAALKPTSHGYFYFVADKNMKTYFATTYNEHVKIINDLKNSGLWYVYK